MSLSARAAPSPSRAAARTRLRPEGGPVPHAEGPGDLLGDVALGAAGVEHVLAEEQRQDDRDGDDHQCQSRPDEGAGPRLLQRRRLTVGLSVAAGLTELARLAVLPRLAV